jgi:hypothetical protein
MSLLPGQFLDGLSTLAVVSTRGRQRANGHRQAVLLRCLRQHCHGARGMAGSVCNRNARTTCLYSQQQVTPADSPGCCGWSIAACHKRPASQAQQRIRNKRQPAAWVDRLLAAPRTAVHARISASALPCASCTETDDTGEQTTQQAQQPSCHAAFPPLPLTAFIPSCEAPHSRAGGLNEGMPNVPK